MVNAVSTKQECAIRSPLERPPSACARPFNTYLDSLVAVSFHTSMGMLLGLGTDTILGVGGPELVIILAVGYFVLGPVELFKLTKQAGVLVGQLRDIGLGTVTNLGKIMDEQVYTTVPCVVYFLDISGF